MKKIKIFSYLAMGFTRGVCLFVSVALRCLNLILPSLSCLQRLPLFRVCTSGSAATPFLVRISASC